MTHFCPDCDRPLATSPRCALDDQRRTIERIYNLGWQSDYLDHLFESISSACERFPNPETKLVDVLCHIGRTIVTNEFCRAPIERLEQLRDALWELVP